MLNFEIIALSKPEIVKHNEKVSRRRWKKATYEIETIYQCRFAKWQRNSVKFIFHVTGSWNFKHSASYTSSAIKPFLMRIELPLNRTSNNRTHVVALVLQSEKSIFKKVLRRRKVSSIFFSFTEDIFWLRWQYFCYGLCCVLIFKRDLATTWHFFQQFVPTCVWQHRIYSIYNYRSVPDYQTM